MAEYDVNILLAKQKNSFETFTEEFDIVAELGDDDATIEEVQQSIIDLVEAELDKSKETVIFGSISVAISETHQIVLNFKNHRLDFDVDEIMDLILWEEETMN